jgi:hypothetical protein
MDLYLHSDQKYNLGFRIKDTFTSENIQCGMTGGEFIDINEFLCNDEKSLNLSLENTGGSGDIKLNITKFTKSVRFKFTNKYDLMLSIKLDDTDLKEMKSDMCNCSYELLNHDVTNK